MKLPAPVLTAFQWSRALKSTGAKAKLIGSKFLHVIQTPTHSLTERTENVRQTTIQAYSFAHLTLMETGTESRNVLRRLLTDEGALAKAAVPPSAVSGEARGAILTSRRTPSYFPVHYRSLSVMRLPVLPSLPPALLCWLSALLTQYFFSR